MLDIHRTDDVTDTKFYASHSLLPGYIDPQNVSTKKKPFATFHAQRFSHTLDLVLPEEIYELIRAELENEDGVARSQYARVYMKLGELLEGDFFNEYIKMGNIMMRSEGRPRVDNVFELYEGILRMEVDRGTYERCGLQGRPIEDGGRKHQKSRWVIEFNLRSPSMVHGKKGFSRLEWACKNVLNCSLIWLFYNFHPSSRDSLPAGKEPIAVHQPFIHNIEPRVLQLRSVLVPKLAPSNLTAFYDQEDSLELMEYLHLLGLDSERVGSQDAIDPHLSRYAVPDFNNGHATKNMVRIRWSGFIPPQFIRDLFLVVWRQGLKVKKVDDDGDVDMEATQTDARSSEGRWISMSANALGGGRGWTVMQWAGRETFVWEGEE